MTRSLDMVRLFAVLLLAAGLAGTADAEEEILSFIADIEVLRDGTLDVTESIKVRAESQQIKRGVYRDFPTRHTRRDGSVKIFEFEIVEILKDGEPEPYHTEERSAGVRIYIGQKDVFIPANVYTYTIHYRTSHQLRFFQSHDELYWNVTGSDWTFPILHAEARVRTPDGARIGELDAFTGKTGQDGKDFRIVSRSDTDFVFETTRALELNEGLTILATWQKGTVQQRYAEAFEECADAYDIGSHQIALNVCRRLAEQGDAKAQFILGIMYHTGQGAPEDKAEALKWYDEAAEQGNIEAMLMLGFYYAPPPPKGDSVKSYMWLLIAAERGSWEAFGALFAADDEMTLDQIAEAKRMAREWQAKHQQ